MTTGATFCAHGHKCYVESNNIYVVRTQDMSKSKEIQCVVNQRMSVEGIPGIEFHDHMCHKCDIETILHNKTLYDFYDDINYLTLYSTFVDKTGQASVVEMCTAQYKLHTALFTLPDYAIDKLAYAMAFIYNDNPSMSGKLNHIYGLDFVQQLKTVTLEQLIEFRTQNVQALQDIKTKRENNKCKPYSHTRNVHISIQEDQHAFHVYYSGNLPPILYFPLCRVKNCAENTLYTVLQLNDIRHIYHIHLFLNRVGQSFETLRVFLMSLLTAIDDAKLQKIDLPAKPVKVARARPVNVDTNPYKNLVERMAYCALHDQDYPYPPCVGGDKARFQQAVDDTRASICRALNTDTTTFIGMNVVINEVMYKLPRTLRVKLAAVYAYSLNLEPKHGKYIGLLLEHGLAEQLNDEALEHMIRHMSIHLNIMLHEMRRRQQDAQGMINYFKVDAGLNQSLFVLQRRATHLLFSLLALNEHSDFLSCRHTVIWAFNKLQDLVQQLNDIIVQALPLLVQV